MRMVAACVVAGIAVLLARTALGGPIADFEARMRGAYAQYRTALIAADAGDRHASAKAVAGFLDDWTGVIKTYGLTPPPHYAEDVDWPGMLDSIRDMAEDARSSLARDDVGDARHSLKEIRDVLADLRRRNGRIAFEDRLKAFHEQMEWAVDADFARADAAQRTVLREQAAVMLYLVGAIRRTAPNHVTDADDYGTLVDTLATAVEAFHDALAGSDRSAMAKTAKDVRPAYIRLFRKYG